MGSKRRLFALPAAVALLFLGCDSAGISRETMEQIRQAHARMLTVGAHVREIDLRGMEKGGLDAAFFVVAVPQGDGTPEAHEKARESALRGIERIRRVTEAQASRIGLGLSPGDAYRNEKQGRLTAFIGLENGCAVGTDLSLVSAYHEKGVRYLTLCGDRDNAVCDSASDRTDPEDRGLSEFGRKVVAECNRVGMIIDLAHASERSFFDVLAASRAPVIVSRSASRALCDRAENLTDEMVRSLASKGGVVMVSFAPERLVPPKPARRSGIPDIADHIGYLQKLAGEEGVGIASDCEDAGDLLDITLELLRRGNIERMIEAIWGGNIMRVFEQVASLAGRA
jgi:membrane dipeptidase